MRRLCIIISVIACAVCLPSCGPRMRTQPSIQPYEQRMPQMPEGTVPTRGRLETLTREQSQLTANPLPRTEANIRNGRIFYGYYCLMCHGADGKGDGIVGQGYVPKPTDLTSPQVVGLSDGELYIKMLTGTGHDPVLIQTVLPQHRWPIVMYVRTLGE